MSYIVMRRPVLMEDEGRHFFVGCFDTVQEAKKWVSAQAGQYHGPSDYYITQEIT